MSSLYPPEFALFQEPELDTPFDKFRYVEYRAQLNSGNPLIFTIPPTSNQYVDLRRTRLHIRAHIETSAGLTPELSSPSFIACCNLTLQSMFKQLDIELQQQLLSGSGSQSYGYKAYLETLLDNDQTNKSTFLQTQGYYKDTAGDMGTDPLENKGFAERLKLSEDGRSFELEGPLMADICQQERAILNGVPIEIRLWPARDEYCLMYDNPSDQTSKFTLKLEDAYLRVCKITPIPAILLAHSDALKLSPAIYPFIRSEIKAFQLNQGRHDIQLEDIFQGYVPTEVIIGMVDASAFNGAYALNPYKFQHFNLNTLGLYLNDESVPSRPLRLDFQTPNCVTGYQTLYDAGYEKANNIQLDDYPNGYTLFKFRTSNGYLPSVSRGNIKIKGAFDFPLKQNITLIVYGKFPSKFTIDAARNVII